MEDWFQVENFKPWISVCTWSERELRVETNIHRILDILDSISVQANGLNSANQELKSSAMNRSIHPKATFFILGWIADRLPGLVSEIARRGHEVASHGQMHQLNTSLTGNQLREDLLQSKNTLEDITGKKVFGYRAPSFAVNDSILSIVHSCGYKYDSSYNSFALNPRYGKISLKNANNENLHKEIFPGFYELPLSNIQLGKITFPWSGGGYFRLLPLFIFIKGIKGILKRQNGYVFYLHPWELDPDQPYFNQPNKLTQLRHYINIKQASSKLTKLIQKFSFATYSTCESYITEKQ